jgi:hypothetical protein
MQNKFLDVFLPQVGLLIDAAVSVTCFLADQAALYG